MWLEANGAMSFDEADRANLLAEREREASIAAIQGLTAMKGRATCADCDEPIEPARRKANPAAVRCIACQRELEVKR